MEPGEGSIEPERKRVRKIKGLGVRRLPRDTLIAHEADGTVTALGLPTKRRKIQGFDIEEDGTAKKRDGTETRSEFIDKADRVSNTNTPITVNRTDGSVAVNRLDKNVTVIKAPTEEPAEAPTETSAETPAEEPAAETTEGAPAEEEKTEEEPNQMQEAKDLHDEEGERVEVLSGDKSEQPPKENDPDPKRVQSEPQGTAEPKANNEKREISDSDRTPEGILTRRLNQMIARADDLFLSDKEGDFEKGQALLEESTKISERLAQIEASKAPAGVKVAEEDDARHDKAQAENQIEQTEQADVEMKKAKEAPETLLSGNQIGGPTPADGKTGAKNDITVAHQMDTDELANAKPSAEAANNVVRDPTVVEEDKNVPGTNQTERIPLSVEADQMELISSKDNVDNNKIGRAHV